MKPVAIFRHVATEGPGYLGEFLDAHQVPWRLIAIDAGDPVPQSAENFAGLVFMGGPMSVNDDLPWIDHALRLIRLAADRDIPLLGHCLGSQLMAKALGGVVSSNPVKEIGWGAVTVADNAVARNWFGDIRNFHAFHWHGETFTVPSGATRVLSSPYCANQGFALGKHLALQCHVEMSAAMIADWCRHGAAEVAANSASPAVQSVATMQQQTPEWLAQLHSVAAALYGRWLNGLNDK